MRTTINIYRQLGKFLETADAEAQERGEGPEDTSIDADFRSGVYLGMGMSNLVLSLMPSRLLAIVELFGYKGDRDAGLAYLQRAGGWTTGADKPSVGLGASASILLLAARTVWLMRADARNRPCEQSRRACDALFATWCSSSSILSCPASRSRAWTFAWPRTSSTTTWRATQTVRIVFLLVLSRLASAISDGVYPLPLIVPIRAACHPSILVFTPSFFASTSRAPHDR